MPGRDNISIRTSIKDRLNIRDWLSTKARFRVPLLVVCLAKAIRNPDGARKQQLANELNLHSVLGSHAINEDVGCYSYRATHWLDTELTPERFFEILSRCVDEADRGYFNLAG